MMNEYDCYANVIKSILKYSKNGKYDTLIPIFLNKMYHLMMMNLMILLKIY